MPMLQALLLTLSLNSIACGRASQSGPIAVYDGFDSPELSALWDTTRLAPGALTLQSAVVRAGRGAVQITLHPKDKFEAGINGSSDSERDELTEARRLTGRQDVGYEQSFSMFFPQSFPIVPVRLVIAQWKQACLDSNAPCSDDSPVLAIRYIGGVLSITQDLAHRQTVLFREAGEFRGRWLDFRFRVRFSPREDGFVQAFLDGRKLVDYKGITANGESASSGYPNPNYFYFKMGLYRDVMPQPMTMYIDEYRKTQISGKP
jgi:hypothetical protein